MLFENYVFSSMFLLCFNKINVKLTKNNLLFILVTLLILFYKYSIQTKYNIIVIFLLSFFWVFLLFFLNINIKSYNNNNNLLSSSIVILIASYIMLTENSIYFTIIGFEFMLLGSLYLLKNTLKTDRGIEALIEMYIWGVFGSFFLLSGLILNYKFELSNNVNNYLIKDLLLLFGFSIKIPLWPFTSWLLKAHVEASTEFSIFLSGFLVKFGVLGCSIVLNNSCSTYVLSIIELLSVIGIIDATIKLFSQVDIKRVVALTTIVETNWLMLCFSQNNVLIHNMGLFLIFIHCLTTTLEFYIVEVIYKRYNTRSINKINSLNLKTPIISKFFTINLLITIGLPGTSIFIIKFIFLSYLLFANYFIFILISIIFLIVLPIFFVRIYLIVNSSYNNSNLKIQDMSKKELSIIIIPMLLSLFLGFNLSTIM